MNSQDSQEPSGSDVVMPIMPQGLLAIPAMAFGNAGHFSEALGDFTEMASPPVLIRLRQIS